MLLLVFTPIKSAIAETAPGLSDVVARVSPSVVGIFVVKREVRENPEEPPRLIASSGSGFAIEGGWIVSNAHVLDHALYAEVTTSDGKTHRLNTEMIYADSVSDLAVAKLDIGLPAVTWGDTQDLRLGQPVFAMGAPYGLRFHGSVSRGVISGFERNLDADYTFVQTDAPINPGNSGGPLFSDAGQVIGVNARGIRGADGMGFSIPVDVVREITAQLIKNGQVKRAWLGLRFVDDQEANFGWASMGGPMITGIDADGPAAKSSLLVGDTVVKLSGTPVNSIEDVGKFLRSVSPGTPVTVTYLRGHREGNVALVLGTRPPDAELYRADDGLWVDLNEAQRERAVRFGKERSFLELNELLDPWTVYQGGAKAVLYTEFNRLALLSWESERAENRLTAAEAESAHKPYRGTFTVEIDLPLDLAAGNPAQLRAEWQDSAGKERALRVSVQSGAPPGFQRYTVQFRSAPVEKVGSAVLILHLDAERERYFTFYLTPIH